MIHSKFKEPTFNQREFTFMTDYVMILITGMNVAFLLTVSGFPLHFEIGGTFGLIHYFCTLNV